MHTKHGNGSWHFEYHTNFLVGLLSVLGLLELLVLTRDMSVARFFSKDLSDDAEVANRDDVVAVFVENK